MLYTNPSEPQEKKKMKKLALVTVINQNVYNRIDQLKWDKNEKEEFIQFVLSLSPSEREELLNEMMDLSSSGL